MRRLGPTHKYTALVPDLSDGGDPDDAFSRIPYEKGFYLLYFLQVGKLTHLDCDDHVFACSSVLSAWRVRLYAPLRYHSTGTCEGLMAWSGSA